MMLGNSRWENAQFNSRLQPTQLGLGNSSSDQSLWKVNYDYGTSQNNGNVLSQTITVPSINPLVQTYAYDSLNRLKSAVETQNSSQTWKQTFTYDRYGNRNFDAAGTTTIPSGCSTAQCNPAVDISNNRFTTGQGYTYDSSGNVTADAQGRTFIYDAESKQKEVRDASNNSIGQYLYDGDGKRVKKISSSDTTVFVYDASGRLTGEYLLTILMPSAPTTSYLTMDNLGSPRVVTDSNGNVQSRRDFMPFGEEISSLGGRSQTTGYQADSVRQKFTSYEKDIESDLDFAQARYYSSKLGRFYSSDPENAGARKDEPQSWNGYTYAGNNPLSITDPTGEKWARRNNDNGTTTFQWYDGDTIPTGEGWGGEWSEYTQSWFVGSDEAVYLGSGGASDYYRVAKEGYFDDHDWNHFRTTQSLAGTINDDQIKSLMTARIEQFTNRKDVQRFLKNYETLEAALAVIHNVVAVNKLIKASGGKALSGYKGNKTFRNDGRGGGEALPKTDSSGKQITYKEYDVNPYTKGLNRGAERIVRGSDGSAYYTDDHYKTFKKIE